MKTNKLILTLFFIFCVNFIFSQKNKDTDLTSNNNFGVSVQVYPAGIIPSINYEYHLSKTSSLQHRLGINIINRQDFSDENDEEKGFGIGGMIGYRYHFLNPKGEFIIGANFDVWNTWIDWRNDINETIQTSGNTYTLVLQPWLEAGYFFKFKNKSKLGITAGFGREINAITNGKEVAQGWIGSLSLQYYFAKRVK